MKKYDLVVIGSGPAGEKAAVKAAYFGYKVALVEKESRYGGAGVYTGTLPSKTLKETALFLSGKREHGLFGVEKKLERTASVEDFLFRKDVVTKEMGLAVEENVELHGVDVFHGEGSLTDEHTIHVKGEKEESIHGEFILIATGSYPMHPPGIPFDGKRVHDSDTILELDSFPKSICIVGAGVIGCEYATIFSTMGCKVYLVNRSDKILPHLDKDVSRSLIEEMRNQGIELLFNSSVSDIKVAGDTVDVSMESGVTLHVDMYLFAAGRSGRTANLNLDKVGVKLGKREAIAVNEEYRTSVPNIFAAGDVIGFPALASTSMDQGRAAVAHMFQTKDIEDIATVLPYGIYTVPEISMVGVTEEEAREKGMDCVTGRAFNKDMMRGKIMGTKHGFLKVVFTRDDLIIRGVHAIGPIAAELIHYGVLLVQDKKTVMSVISAVFNIPTLHELYKYACYDGLCNLTGKRIKP